MANIDAPRGFQAVRTLDGSKLEGCIMKFRKTASTIIAPGDPIVLLGTGDSLGEYATVDRAAAGSGTITGVVAYVEHDEDSAGAANKEKFLAAADSGYVYAYVGPHVVYEIQEDSDGGNIAITAIGEFCDIVVANANTTTGMSQVELDSGNAGTGDQVRILNIARREDNELGANCRWEVTINEHTLNSVQTPI